MRVLVTGASSFVGAWFCTHAAARGHTVLGLWNTTPLLIDGITPITSDLTLFTPADIDVVVHLACKVMGPDAPERNRRMLDRVLDWGLPLVYASSTVVHWPSDTAYARARREDEERVRSSGAPWLILRPCAPYGPPHPTHRPRHAESFHRLARWARRSPVVPVVGSGAVRRQPVHVEDFAASAMSLVERGAWNAAYDAGGPEPMTVAEIVRALAGGPRALVPVPPGAAAAGSRLLGGFEPELVRAFSPDDVVDPRPLAEASGVTPRPFAGVCAPCAR
jgi:nucleoside-diphosphate-sugar epimerase